MTSLRIKHAWIIVLLGLLSVVTPFAIDMYLPAFSQLAADFRTPPSAIDLSLSTYFIGFALGQILYGPLLDRFGRKRPLYFGLIVYIVASVGLAQAHSIHAFIALRFIQALRLRRAGRRHRHGARLLPRPRKRPRLLPALPHHRNLAAARAHHRQPARLKPRLALDLPPPRRQRAHDPRAHLHAAA